MNRFKLLSPKPGQFKEMPKTHSAALGGIRDLVPRPQAPAMSSDPAPTIPSAHLNRQAHAERLLNTLLTQHFTLTEAGTLRARESAPELSPEFTTYWRSIQ